MNWQILISLTYVLVLAVNWQTPFSHASACISCEPADPFSLTHQLPHLQAKGTKVVYVPPFKEYVTGARIWPDCTAAKSSVLFHTANFVPGPISTRGKSVTTDTHCPACDKRTFTIPQFQVGGPCSSTTSPLLTLPPCCNFKVWPVHTSCANGQICAQCATFSLAKVMLSKGQALCTK